MAFSPRESQDAERKNSAFRQALSARLHICIGMTDAVLATQLTPEQRHDLPIVKDSASSLLKITDDILDFFKIAEP
jgi:hypothetical protein